MSKITPVFIILFTLAIVISGCQPDLGPQLTNTTEPLKTENTKPLPPKSAPDITIFDSCADILKEFVGNNGSVNYKELKRNRLKLKTALNKFAKLDPDHYNSWPKEDKIAFWINAYNLQMLKIITDNYPIKSTRIHRLFWHPASIRHIRGIWDTYKFIVTEEEFTLRQVEEKILTQLFDKPEAFFAICYASLSGPPLRNEPYYGFKLNRQTDDQIRNFLARPEVFRIDKEKHIVFLSAILQPNWHGRRFISKYGTNKKFKDKKPAVRAVLNFITNYTSEQNIYFLETENYSVKYNIYDWRLNQ